MLTLNNSKGASFEVEYVGTKPNYAWLCLHQLPSLFNERGDNKGSDITNKHKFAEGKCG